MTFLRTLKYHITMDGFCTDLNINPDSMSDTEINAAKAMALRVKLAGVRDSSVEVEMAFVDRLLANDVASRPCTCCKSSARSYRRCLPSPRARGGVGLHSIHVADIYRSITRLQDVLGACERLYRTPVYTGYVCVCSGVYVCGYVQMYKCVCSLGSVRLGARVSACLCANSPCSCSCRFKTAIEPA